MTRDLVIQKLREHEASLRRLGVERAALFGSTARNTRHAESDIDVMVELDTAARLSVYDYVDIINYISDLFVDRVDVVNRAALKHAVRATALHDAVYAF